MSRKYLYECITIKSRIPEEVELSEIHPKEAATTTIFSHGSDSTDSDFIQSHVDSFFPPADSKEEVIEENLEENIGKEEGDEGIPDDAEMILDLLLYSDKELETKIANYTELKTPQTAGLAPDVIQLIPWTGFEMHETGELPEEITYSDVI